MRRRHRSYGLWALLLMGVTIAAVDAAEKSPATAPAAGKIVYRPPQRGAPVERIGGGVRGDSDKLPLIAVLAPPPTALTTQAQPKLYWFLSDDTKMTIELTITRDDRDEPVYEARLKGSKAGFHALDVAAAGIKLESGVAYHWNIDLIIGTSSGSGDVVAGGAIMRVKPSSTLTSLLRKSTPAQRPAIYAENSIWYDGVAALEDEIEHDPSNQALRETRADLLRQVGLNATADAVLPPAPPTEQK